MGAPPTVSPSSSASLEEGVVFLVFIEVGNLLTNLRVTKGQNRVSNPAHLTHRPMLFDTKRALGHHEAWGKTAHPFFFFEIKVVSQGPRRLGGQRPELFQS